MFDDFNIFLMSIWLYLIPFFIVLVVMQFWVWTYFNLQVWSAASPSEFILYLCAMTLLFNTFICENINSAGFSNNSQDLTFLNR